MGPIFGDFWKKIKNVFAHCGHVFQLFSKILTPVGRLKCLDTGTTPFFDGSLILRWFNWLRSKNGTKFWPNGTIFFGFFWSLWTNLSLFSCFFGTSK